MYSTSDFHDYQNRIRNFNCKNFGKIKKKHNTKNSLESRKVRKEENLKIILGLHFTDTNNHFYIFQEKEK